VWWSFVERGHLCGYTEGVIALAKDLLRYIPRRFLCGGHSLEEDVRVVISYNQTGYKEGVSALLMVNGLFAIQKRFCWLLHPPSNVRM